MIKANPRKKIFNQINDWLNAIQTIPNERIRENLYNVEQYRLDVLNISEIKGKSPALGSGLPKVLSNSTKTSGTSNLVGGGGSSSLTGKNQFAILKASAMNTSTATYPNNFTNLPKCTPPFLPPLEGEARLKTYTLVLDLDETLIHNVEVRFIAECLVWS